MQPHLINNLINKFGDEVLEKRVYKTPGTPIFKIIFPDDAMGSYLEMLRIVKFALDTKAFCSKNSSKN
jgi:hypothetical protein